MCVCVWGGGGVECVDLILGLVDRRATCNVVIENGGHRQLADFLELDQDFDGLVFDVLYFKDLDSVL